VRVPVPPIRQLACVLAVVASVTWWGGCASDPNQGYSFDSAHDASMYSINVPVFTNTTFSHGIELELTDAIVKQLKVATPWKVTSESTAQTTLTGKITDTRMQALSIGRTSGIVQEQAVLITIEFTWRDNRSGKILVSRRNFSASEIFVPSQGVLERVEVGQSGAIQKLARGVVDELRSSW
jgi:hypothetical protein